MSLVGPLGRQIVNDGVLPDLLHDAGHVGFVANTLFRIPEVDVRGSANGREHLVHKFAEAWITTAFVTAVRVVRSQRHRQMSGTPQPRTRARRYKLC